MSGSGINWAICKSAPRSRQITMPAPHHSVFTGRMPFLSPNQQHQSTKALNGNGTKDSNTANRVTCYWVDGKPWQCLHVFAGSSRWSAALSQTSDPASPCRQHTCLHHRRRHRRLSSPAAAAPTLCFSTLQPDATPVIRNDHESLNATVQYMWTRTLPAIHTFNAEGNSMLLLWKSG